MVFAGDDFVSNKKLYTWGVYHHMLLTKLWHFHDFTSDLHKLKVLMGLTILSVK